jgi:hypothetical protein
LREPQVGRGGADIEPLCDRVENLELVEIQSRGLEPAFTSIGGKTLLQLQIGGKIKQRFVIG